MTEFKIRADQYEENRHFFLAQYFRDRYDDALSTLPTISSSINITRMEVWVTNVGAATEDNRNIVAFADLGEYDPHHNSVSGPGTSAPPDNRINNLIFSGPNGGTVVNPDDIRVISNVNSTLGGLDFSSGSDYENVENARRLRSNEYTFNPSLGFISLNRTISPTRSLPSPSSMRSSDRKSPTRWVSFQVISALPTAL